MKCPTCNGTGNLDSCVTPFSFNNPAAVYLGRKGGKLGGPARAKKLTPERRREISQNAARARWWKKPPKISS